MSSPFVYTPQSQYQPTPYNHAHFNTPQHSPFIPDATLYPTSPYANSTSLPGSPHFQKTGLPSTVPFPGDYGAYAPQWEMPQRQRRPSWHGADFPGTPMMGAQWLQPDPTEYHRRHSFGHAGSPYHSPQGWPYQAPNVMPSWQQQSLVMIHPWLNGEAPRGDFFFDLSSGAFAPTRLVGPGQSVILSMEDLQQPATHPAITKLEIVHEKIPQWPIHLQFDPYHNGQPFQGVSPNAPPPINVGDILTAIHRFLHQRITHQDWARLSLQEETEISRAYTRRCKNIPNMEVLERAQGVKRVDFLLSQTRFKGLVRVGTGWERMRMILA